MNEYIKEKYIRDIFNASIILKGLDGFLETIGAALLLLIKPAQLTIIIRFLTQRELLEDPKDIIANYLSNITRHYSLSTELFLALYLCIHGLIKIIIVAGLLKNKLWAYPLGMIIFSVFVIYQIYQYTQSQSISFIILTIFDIFVILLTWHEYKLMEKMTQD